VWFGVLLAVNMQTSFMHPPFGFALFYLRSVAPSEDYDDRITSRRISKVTTGQIYWGAVPFVLIQVLMVGLIITFPKLVSSGLGKEPTVDVDKAFQQMQIQNREPARDAPPMFGTPPTPSAPAPADAAPSAPPATGEQPKQGGDDDAMKRLLDSMQGDKEKKP